MFDQLSWTTAYFGLAKTGKPKAQDVFVQSKAAGMIGVTDE